jgi:hypothetical protein
MLDVPLRLLSCLVLSAFTFTSCSTITPSFPGGAQPLVISPNPSIGPLPPLPFIFSLGPQRPPQTKVSKQRTVHTVISPNRAYTATIVQDEAEMSLYLQERDLYTLIDVYSAIEGVTWSEDSTTLRFRATKIVGPEKVEKREATYQPATRVLKWSVISVTRPST